MPPPSAAAMVSAAVQVQAADFGFHVLVSVTTPAKQLSFMARLNTKNSLTNFLDMSVHHRQVYQGMKSTPTTEIEITQTGRQEEQVRSHYTKFTDSSSLRHVQ